jgi:transcriptional regulator with XRE-family HTH domain
MEKPEHWRWAGHDDPYLEAREQLATHIRQLRIVHGWTQQALSDLVGMHRSYVGALERAERNISLDNLERLAIALNVTLSSLLDSKG